MGRGQEQRIILPRVSIVLRLTNPAPDPSAPPCSWTFRPQLQCHLLRQGPPAPSVKGGLPLHGFPSGPHLSSKPPCWLLFTYCLSALLGRPEGSHSRCRWKFSCLAPHLHPRSHRQGLPESHSLKACSFPFSRQTSFPLLGLCREASAAGLDLSGVWTTIASHSHAGAF